MKCYGNKWRCTGLLHLHGAWRDVLFVLVWLPYTFTSCFPSNTIVNYWCYHHVSLPPSLSPPVPYTPALCRHLRAWLSLRRTGCTQSQWQYPIKRGRGEGQDAPWHLNQLLSYNNSMIFNPSLLPSSLQSLKQHTGFYHSRQEKQDLNESLGICSGLSAQMAKMAS